MSGTTGNNNRIMEESQCQKSSSTKAQAFYNFFRSMNNNEIQINLGQIASNPDLDKQDLALLVLMLRNISQPYVRRLIRESSCSQILQGMLETVRNNENKRGMRPFPDDVEEIEMIIHGPPLSPDIA
ncbi:uncharacterized protein LOC105445933 [Strongylocentrotus purpuratus]|uniref:Uncharacterized protein n=1 Tax=Strongylocentrotus purpuratus TaxID=7668 RepID=A0A7M7HLT6_STRPU|nr:uncharacterized protein LOC105445933 [Strongylocentrotus purpuratus]XP_011680389.1 uncharacterized protein LOC105445933 [Strongylocentrotus purpuratus]|eukprot:XP_011680388.1 PREDICTED: uncharacterized protein LOC105445933 [Strongylocentrotus purpuratus]